MVDNSSKASETGATESRPRRRAPQNRTEQSQTEQSRIRSGEGTSGNTRIRPENRQSSQKRPTRTRGYRSKSQRPRKRVIMLVNCNSSQYDSGAVEKFSQQLTTSGFEVTTLKPSTSGDMAKQAAEAAKKRPLALVAVGGDGAVNLVARAVIGTDVRLAVLPQGKCNNFFTSLIGKPSLGNAVAAFVGGKFRSVDCGAVSGQPFFTSVGLGLLPALSEALAERSLPRFGIGWSRLAARVAAGIERQRTPVRIDAYRFDLEPLMITVSLLPYCLGLKLSPTALVDDHRLEVTLDMGEIDDQPSKFIRSVYKEKYSFDGSYRLYRGEEIIIGSTKGRMLYLDGELISTPTNNLEINVQSEQIRVCVPAD